jgi:hypothetical protein
LLCSSISKGRSYSRRQQDLLCQVWVRPASHARPLPRVRNDPASSASAPQDYRRPVCFGHRVRPVLSLVVGSYLPWIRHLPRRAARRAGIWICILNHLYAHWGPRRLCCMCHAQSLALPTTSPTYRWMESKAIIDFCCRQLRGNYYLDDGTVNERTSVADKNR